MEPQNTAAQNYDLKEQIRTYWSKRSESFDTSPGHAIENNSEFDAWRALFLDIWADNGHADYKGFHVLDLACGTGEISRVFLSLEAIVTGVDFSEATLERAKRKHVQATALGQWVWRAG
ncbi:MAG: methyltransferase domain-containing protein [Hyphomicrobiales bacterium]